MADSATVRPFPSLAHDRQGCSIGHCSLPFSQFGNVERMMKDFRDRVAVVTGAASGIGLGIASSLVKRGVAVVMIDVEATTLEAAAAKISADGAHVMPLLVDVSDRTAMSSTADKIRHVVGRLHSAVKIGK